MISRKKADGHVLVALIPCLMGSVYFFGWRSVFVALACAAVFVTAARSGSRPGKTRQTVPALVTGILYSLIMPPSVPWHVLLTGAVFAAAIGPGLAANEGRTLFNPALAGKCFAHAAFPSAMTANWAPAAPGPFGALGYWSTMTAPDSVVKATPVALLRQGAEADPGLLFEGLFLGRTEGTMGTTSALLVILGGIYLLWSGSGSKAIIFPLVLVYGVLTHLLWQFGVSGVDAAVSVMGSGFLFGAVFLATDPATTPVTRKGQVLYAVAVAVIASVISISPAPHGGLLFGVLLANMLVPAIDRKVGKRTPGQVQAM